MRINIALSLAIGVGGLILAGASLPVDTQITHRTQLGDRVQPYWLVPEQAKMLKVRGGLGIVRLFGAIASATGFGLAMHFAGEDERQQEQFWFRRSALDVVSQKTEQTFAEIDASTELNKKQMEAQAEVDLFSLRVQQNFRDAVGYVPQNYEQPALTHGKPGTLDEMTNPGDKVQQQEVGVLESRHQYLDMFLRETSLLWGNQGSGKSWTARLLAKRKNEAGYRLIVLDPDSNRSEWVGTESYHLFEDIEKQIRWYIDELKRRYRAFNQSSMSEDEWRSQLEPIAFICDEITTYENFLDPVLLEEFFKLALTKSRKQEMPCTFLAHNNTQLAFGKKLTGLSNLIEKTLQLELVTTTNPQTLKPESSGKGRFKGYESSQVIDVLLPKCDQKITDFRVDSIAPSTAIKSTNVASEYLERAWGMEFDLGAKFTQDSPVGGDDDSNSPASDGLPDSTQGKVSGFCWTVRRCHEFYPENTPEQLFESVSVAAESGESVRNIIKNILKCREGNEHKNRSYSQHGKTLLRWLIANYDNGSIAALPEIQKFLNND